MGNIGKIVVDHKGNVYESTAKMIEAYGINDSTYYSRLRAGWTLQEILETPKHSKETGIKRAVNTDYGEIGIYVNISEAIRPRGVIQLSEQDFKLGSAYAEKFADKTVNLPKIDLDKASVITAYKVGPGGSILGADINIVGYDGEDYTYPNVSVGCLMYLIQNKYISGVRWDDKEKQLKASKKNVDVISISRDKVKDFNCNILKEYDFRYSEARHVIKGYGNPNRATGAIIDNRGNVVGLRIKMNKREKDYTLRAAREVIKKYGLPLAQSCGYTDTAGVGSARTSVMGGVSFCKLISIISPTFDFRAAEKLFGKENIRILNDSAVDLSEEVEDDSRVSIIRQLNRYVKYNRLSRDINSIGEEIYYRIPIYIDKYIDGESKKSYYSVVHTNLGFWVIENKSIPKNVECKDKRITFKYVPWYLTKSEDGKYVLYKKYNGKSKYWV